MKANNYSQFSSKNRQRALNLVQKLQGDYNQQDTGSQLLDEKYLQIADHMRAFHSKNQRNFNWFQQQLQKYEYQVKSVGRSIDKNNELQKQLINNLQRDLKSQHTDYCQQLRRMKKGIIDQIQHKYRTIRNDAIQEISNDFDSLCKYNQNQMNKKINKVMDILEDQRLKKQQNAQYLIITFGDQIINLQQAIAKEKSARIQNNQMLFDRIDQIQQKIENQFNEHIRQRQKQEDKRDKQLQEVCYQIQVRALGKN